ncbi:hypothetical protein [uncultured Draconibacterium sp.]|uniref:hypothetical protein n=1 Tax=uncultured Draconibacterium sp. TaxID=1573823 RepID=UPI00321806E0
MKKITFLLSLILYALAGISQTYVISDLSTLSDQYTVDKSGKSGFIAPNIDGTPYLNDEFIVGEVIVEDSIRFELIPLRYNIYNDKMEFKNKNSQVLEISNSTSRYQFHFEDFLFCNQMYSEDGLSKQGILELLVDGQVKLFKKYNIELQPAAKAIGFQEATPDRFVQKEEQYLLAVGKEIPYVFGNPKKLLPVLEKIKPEVNSYVKTQKLKLRSEKDLIVLIQCCNQ